MCSMLKIIYSVLSLLKSNRTIFHEPICISFNCVKLHLKNCHKNRNGRKQKKSNWEINFKFTKIKLQRESLTVDHCNIIWTICFYFSSRQEVMDSMFLCFNHYYVIKKIITGEACHNKIHSLLKFMIIVLNYQTITYLYGWRFQTVYEGKILKVIWVPFTFFFYFWSFADGLLFD